MEKLDKMRAILGTESIRETISAASREVIRYLADRSPALAASPHETRSGRWVAFDTASG